jgi:hypothetical protein
MMNFESLNLMLRHFNTTSYKRLGDLWQVRHFATNLYHYFQRETNGMIVEIPMTSCKPLLNDEE